MLNAIPHAIGSTIYATDLLFLWLLCLSRDKYSPTRKIEIMNPTKSNPKKEHRFKTNLH